jgi:hypothetical protein
MFDQRIRYRGSVSYNPETKQGYYVLFDFIKNESFPRETFNNTTEDDLIQAFGRAQKKYYTLYPRFLPKGININNDENFNFQLNLLNIDGQPIYIGKYITIQDAMLTKKGLIALNIE